MNHWYAGILACPDCGGTLKNQDKALVCTICTFYAPLIANIDLTPQKHKTIALEVPQCFDSNKTLASVALAAPENTYRGPKGIRDASELLSVMQQTLLKPSLVLDLGCGPRDQADPVAFLGHEYVGIDFDNPAADIRADAHALPFRSSSFDFVLSYAVLEHLHNPFLALSEVKRVLKPGGVFCGTVSQGEPFHNSFFHHTPWGLLSVARANNLEPLRLWPSWDTLSGLAEMGRYPRVIRYGIQILDCLHKALPILAPRKMGWSSEDKFLDQLYRSASFCFVIRKKLEDLSTK